MFQPFVVDHSSSFIVAQGTRENDLEHQFRRRTFWLCICSCSVCHLDCISSAERYLQPLLFRAVQKAQGRTEEEKESKPPLRKLRPDETCSGSEDVSVLTLKASLL